MTAGIVTNVTVTAQDPSGHVVSGYTGTVHFTSTDLAALLLTVGSAARPVQSVLSSSNFKGLPAP